ncbi:aldo/keto reductase [bacterium]|nr:aldo/keto reductase [bacterium]
MKKIKLNNGTEIPAIGFGVFLIPDDGTCEKAVSDALDVGYRFIDTAAAYMNESGVGKAISKSGLNRDEIYVTSKLWLQDYGYDAAKKGIETSLKNLNLDYIDLYLLHQPYFDTAGAWKALEEAVLDGKIRSIGLSNHTVGFLDKLIQQMKILPVVNQMECNPLFQQKDLRKYLSKYDIKLQAWYPLGHGNKELFENPVLNNIASKYSKTVSQIILRWHIEEGIIPIPKSTSMAHIKENFDIFDFSLDKDDMTKIRSIDTGKGSHNPDDLSFGETLLKAYKIHD